MITDQQAFINKHYQGGRAIIPIQDEEEEEEEENDEEVASITATALFQSPPAINRQPTATTTDTTTNNNSTTTNTVTPDPIDQTLPSTQVLREAAMEDAIELELDPDASPVTGANQPIPTRLFKLNVMEKFFLHHIQQGFRVITDKEYEEYQTLKNANAPMGEEELEEPTPTNDSNPNQTGTQRRISFNTQQICSRRRRMINDKIG